MQRLMLAAGVLGPAAVTSYALQRLVDAQSEPAGILLTAHIPYYWRAGMAGLHGLALAVLLAALVRQPEEWLRRLPRAVLLSVGLSVLAMCICP